MVGVIVVVAIQQTLITSHGKHKWYLLGESQTTVHVVNFFPQHSTFH